MVAILAVEAGGIGRSAAWAAVTAPVSASMTTKEISAVGPKAVTGSVSTAVGGPAQAVSASAQIATKARPPVFRGLPRD